MGCGLKLVAEDGRPIQLYRNIRGTSSRRLEMKSIPGEKRRIIPIISKTSRHHSSPIENFPGRQYKPNLNKTDYRGLRVTTRTSK